MDEFWQELRRRADLYGGHVVAALVILVVGFVALRYLTAPLRRLLERSRLEVSTASFVANSVRALLITVIIVGVLQQLGVETTSLLTVLAAGGLAIALGVQNALVNFSAGLVLLSFRMLRAGDLIEAGGMRGRVAEILPFHVVLLTDDNQVATVPNSLLTGNGFRNYSARPEYRVQWTLAVRPDDDLATMKAALAGRLLADARVLRQPAPRAFVLEWTDDKRVLAVQAWAATADHQAVQEELLEALGSALEGQRRAASGPSGSSPSAGTQPA
jgi:small conductance mechanosensitive channel